MKKTELEKHIGKKVRIDLFDGDVIEGFLFQTGSEIFKDDPNLFLPKNYYVLTDEAEAVSCIFRSSHVRKLKEV